MIKISKLKTETTNLIQTASKKVKSLLIQLGIGTFLSKNEIVFFKIGKQFRVHNWLLLLMGRNRGIIQTVFPSLLNDRRIEVSGRVPRFVIQRANYGHEASVNHMHGLDNPVDEVQCVLRSMCFEELFYQTVQRWAYHDRCILSRYSLLHFWELGCGVELNVALIVV